GDLPSFPTRRSSDLSAPFRDQDPSCFSLISASVLQSMQSVAVGRASRRRMPISTPQESHQPYSLSSISCSVSSIFLISLRSRSRSEEHTSELQSREN